MTMCHEQVSDVTAQVNMTHRSAEKLFIFTLGLLSPKVLETNRKYHFCMHLVTVRIVSSEIRHHSVLRKRIPDIHSCHKILELSILTEC